jgi:hypothetical protein
MELKVDGSIVDVDDRHTTTFTGNGVRGLRDRNCATGGAFGATLWFRDRKLRRNALSEMAGSFDDTPKSSGHW